jgi:signal transduction histidine kinase
MASPLRPTGIGVVGDMPWGMHFCHFYQTKNDLLDILIPYFKAGLENNEFCMWVISEPISEDEARNALRSAIPETDRHLAAGDIEIIPYSQWYFKDGVLNLSQMATRWKEKLAQALGRGYAGMRVSGNVSWLTSKHWKNFLDYEKALGQAIVNQRIIIMCTYPLEMSKAAKNFDVTGTHQFAIARRGGKWEVADTPALIQARQEVKRLNDELQRGTKGTAQPPTIWSYGVAVLSVTAALIIAEFLQRQYDYRPFTPFFCAIMFSAWFGGATPGLLAVALSLLSFHHYFLIPVYPMEKEIPRLIFNALTSFFIVWLGAAQRSATESLKRARDVLEGTIQELKRTNESLQAENAERKRADEAVRESQQLLHLVLATLPVGVVVTDRAGNIVLDNAAAKRIWGDIIVSGSERWAQSKGFWHDSGKQIAPSDWPSIRALSEGQAILNKLIDIETFDGQKKIIQNSTVPIRNTERLIVGAVIVNEDVTERVHAEAALKNSHDQLRAFTARLESLREEERIRIAREIHDDLGQKLTGLKMDLRRAERKIEGLESSPAVNSLLDTIVSTTELVDGITASIQEIAANLRPEMLDKLGLNAALHFESRRFQERTGVLCESRLPETELNLSTQVSTALFRIYQECLTNITRHAHATRIQAELKLEGGWVNLRVQDNGRGITEAEIANPESLGLLGMKERTALLGGEIVFYGDPEGGTIVTVRIPKNGTSGPAKEFV